jgi:DNA-binding NarL/FixJ family response regulator
MRLAPAVSSYSGAAVAPAAAAAGAVSNLNLTLSRFIYAEPPMKPLRTYIVEDSRLIRENLVATLEELLPLKVVGDAEDAPTAVAWLRDRSNECDLGIVDIFLKRGSGLEVLSAARAARQAMKLVVLTNYATGEVRRKCEDLGADRVFDKSNELENLMLYCESLAAAKADGPHSEPAP